MVLRSSEDTPLAGCRAAVPGQDRLYAVEGPQVVHCLVIADDAHGRFPQVFTD